MKPPRPPKKKPVKVHGSVSYIYNPAFVESILQADAAPVEASFDNVIDMLEWLEN